MSKSKPDACRIDVSNGLRCSGRFPRLVGFFGVKFLFNVHFTPIIRVQIFVDMNCSVHFAFFHPVFTLRILAVTIHSTRKFVTVKPLNGDLEQADLPAPEICFPGVTYLRLS